MMKMMFSDEDEGLKDSDETVCSICNHLERLHKERKLANMQYLQSMNICRYVCQNVANNLEQDFLL